MKINGRQAEAITAETQIYLADTLGELGTLFSRADLTIMGGSFLTGIGGHNPLEPARLGKSVITGQGAPSRTLAAIPGARCVAIEAAGRIIVSELAEELS